MIAPGTSGIVVTMRHVRQAKLCGRGTRTWFAGYAPEIRTQFVADGLPVEWFEALGDPFADRVAALAREEAAGGR